MRGVARVGAALLRSGGLRGAALRGAALRDAAARGIDLATQVGDAASEVVRTRRDPVLLARRRQVSARRRLIGWSVTSLLVASAGTALLVGVVRGDVSAATIGTLVLVAGLLVYCLIGVTTAGIDLAARTRTVRRLPPPQPRRQAVAVAVRPAIQRLDGYSDALRQAVAGMDGPAADPAMRELRDRTLVAADAAESRLRRQAAEVTAILRGGTPRPGTPVADTCERIRRDIAAGVDEYERLVAAASGVAAASADLAAGTAPAGSVADVTERLTAIAAGMREIIGSAAPGR